MGTPKNTIHKTRKLYKIGLIIIVLLLVSSYGLNRYWTGKNEGAATTINLAGRQRMLSQKIAKQVLSENFSTLDKSLFEDLDDWKSIHIALQQGNDSLRIPTLEGENLKSYFAKITPHIDAIVDIMESYREGSVSYEDVKTVVGNNEKQFLNGMDIIVFILDEQAEDNLRNLEWLELISSLLIIISILGGYFLALNPISSSLFSVTEKLSENEQIINLKNEELERQVGKIKQQNEELKVFDEELRSSLETQNLLNENLMSKLSEITRQREQLEGAQKLVQIGYWHHDLKDSVFWSEMMYEIFGVERKEGQRLTIEDTTKNIHPEDLDEVLARSKNITKKKESQFIHRIIHPDGNIKTVKSFLKVQFNNEGTEAEGIFGTVQDITEQVQREQELQSFNNRLKKIVAFSSESNKNLSKSINDILEYTTNMLNMEVGMISNITEDVYEIKYWYSNTDEIVLEENQKFKLQDIYCDITYQKNKLFTIEDIQQSRYSKHSGYHMFKFESYIGIPIVINGKKWGTLSFSSKKKKNRLFKIYEKDFIKILERIFSFVLERSEYVDELELINQNQENIFHVIAHDLRGPLSKLYTVITMLESDLLSEDEKKEFFELAKVEYKAGEDLMNDMLASFKLDYDNNQEKENCNISELLNEFTERNHNRINEHGIVLRSSIIPFIEANILKNDLFRALDNILSNAIKFTPTDGEIFIALIRDTDYFTIIITDTGIGIPKDLQPFLFEKFSKKIRRVGLNGEKTNGLGMSIVKQIVDAHQGEISVISQENKGTSISIKIPFE